MAALLPLAALAALHLVPSAAKGTPLPWVAPGVAAVATAATGVAMLIAITAALAGGRLRDHADSAGMGILAVAFAVVALGSTRGLGLGVGLVVGAAAFALASAAGARVIATLRERTATVVITLVLVEASLALILLIGPGLADDRMAIIPLIGASILLAIAAITTFDEPGRATALGIAASSVLAMALATSADGERLVGPIGIAAAAVVAYWSVVRHRLQRRPAEAVADEEDDHPEYDELARLSRELRATIDDLIGARRTIELQRVEIERATTLDPLTGLPGRIPTLERLRIDAAEARRYAHPVAAVLLDIDGFADLNHQNGLQVGDAILREMALRLRLRIRAADELGRVGADSFLAILPHTDEGGATTFARAVLDRMMDRPFATERGDLSVKVSIGVALMAPGMTIGGEDLLAAAEEALQAAKIAGGNRVTFDRVLGVARLDARESPAGDIVDETG